MTQMVEEMTIRWAWIAAAAASLFYGSLAIGLTKDCVKLNGVTFPCVETKCHTIEENYFVSWPSLHLKQLEKNFSRSITITWKENVASINQVENLVGFLIRLQNAKDTCIFIKTYRINLRDENTLTLNHIDCDLSHCLSLNPVYFQELTRNRRRVTCKIHPKYEAQKNILHMNVTNLGAFLQNGVGWRPKFTIQIVKESCTDGSPLWTHVAESSDFKDNGFLANYKMPKKEGKFCIKLGSFSPTRKKCFSQVFSLNEIKSNAPMELNGCVREGKNDDEWNVTIILTSEPARSAIEASFILITTSESPCYKNFHVLLYNTTQHSCEGTITNSALNTTQISLAKNGNSTVFSGVSPGNYCVRIKPIKCSDCSYRNSRIIELKEHFPSSAIPIVTPEVDPIDANKVIYIAVAIILILSTGLVLGFIYYKRRKKPISMNAQIFTETLMKIIEDTQVKPRMNVFLVHYFEQSRNRKLVPVFIKVLEKVLHCKVIEGKVSDMKLYCTKSGNSELFWITEQVNQVDKIICIAPDFDIENAIETIDYQERCEEEKIFMITRKILANRFTDRNMNNVIVIRFENVLHYPLLSNFFSVHVVMRGIGNLFGYLHHQPVDEKEFQKYWENESCCKELNEALKIRSNARSQTAITF